MKRTHPLKRRDAVQARISLRGLRKKRRLAVLGLAGALIGVIFCATIADIEAQGTISLNRHSWTFIGPAPSIDNDHDFDSTGYIENTSGRITGIAAHPTQVGTTYIAAAGGGVWKTTNGGSTWTPLTDHQPAVAADKRTLFMGAIAVAPSSPNIIYAGTGEANFGPSKASGEFRDNIYYGRGVLKSVNGGSSWTLLTGDGEDASLDNFDRRAISRIVVDPTNPDTVYVAVGAQATNGRPGNTGIWKSRNGGQTWKNTTAGISNTTAFTDLVIDAADPQTLYAAVGGYQPDGVTGDLANGVYKTTNAGASWMLLCEVSTGHHRPCGEATGRIALAIAPSNHQVLYAAIADPSKNNRLLKIWRTADGGASWAAPDNLQPGNICPSGSVKINYLGGAGDYHNTLAIDPTDPDIVYAGGICLIARSTFGGTWFAIGDGVTTGPHRDHHALVFDAAGKLLNGNDGGIWRLFDRQRDDPNNHGPNCLHWTNMNGNLGITQFVGLSLHPTDRNRAYGGTQDTGTQRFEGTLKWRRVLRGDGATSAVSADQPNRIYQIVRLTRFTEAGRIAPFFRRSDDDGNNWIKLMSGINKGAEDDPMNWYPPLALDPSDSNRLLLGTDRIYETVTGGDPKAGPPYNNNGWRAISSPMMSGWDVRDRIDSLAVAETNGNTIYALTGGAHETAMSQLFVTVDGGVNWQRGADFADHIRTIILVNDPAHGLTAYAVRDRFGGGHVFRNRDGGQHWIDISGSDPDPNLRLPDLPAYSIVVDPRFTPNVLYIGNDSGVYVSTDDGVTWLRFRTGLPNAQVVDLKLNTTLNLLVAATHGRGVWQILLQ